MPPHLTDAEPEEPEKVLEPVDNDKLAISVLSVPPVVLDTISIVGALIGSIAVAPLMSIGYDDLEAAALRHNATYGQGTDFLISYFAGCNGYASSLCLASIVSSVIVRISGALLIHVPADQHQMLGRFLKPLIVASGVFLAVALILFVFGLYWLGWIILPPHIATSPNWFFSGGWVILFMLLLYLYILFMVCFIKRSKKSRGGLERRCATGRGDSHGSFASGNASVEYPLAIRGTQGAS